MVTSRAAEAVAAPSRQPSMPPRLAECDGLVGFRLGHDRAEAGAHVVLGVHGRVVETGEVLDHAEDGGDGRQRFDGESGLGFEAAQVEEAPARDVEERAHIEFAQQGHGQVDVHGRRFEQLLAERASELLDVAAELPARLAEGAARERKAVAVDARRGETDERITGSDAYAREDAVALDEPSAGTPEVERAAGARAPQHLGDTRGLAARDRDASASRALAQAHRDLRQERLVHLLYEHAIDHRDRLRAHADDVVGVHGDAVDASRVELAQSLGDQRLRTDGVGGQCERLRPARIDDRGVVPESEKGVGPLRE